MSDKIAQFNVPTGQRMLDATRGWENFAGTSPTTNRSRAAGTFCKIAKAITQITARNEETPGFGNVKFWRFDNPLIVEVDEEIKIYNMSSQAIDIDKYLICIRVDGCWFADFEDC